MRRADRLFLIVQYLRGGRLATAKRLAERLEVSERTVYRDIADLQANGVPIDGEAGVGYVLRSGFHLPPLMFTRDELAALTLGGRLAKAWGGGRIALAAEEALIKIAAVLPEAERAAAAEAKLFALCVDMPATVRAHLDLLDAAITERRRVAFAYTSLSGERTRRTVRPLGLYHWGKVWTLAAWCELRRDFRTFRVDLMDRLDAGGEAFRPEPGRSLRDYLLRVACAPRPAAER